MILKYLLMLNNTSMDKPSIITKMIQEELNSMVNKPSTISDDRFKFKQRLNNSFFVNYDNFTSEFDSEITQSDIIVSWTVSFWVNQTGIQNFIIDVEDVMGTFILQLYDLHTDELKQETPKNIQDYQWKYVIEDTNLPKDGGLAINDLTFDFQNKTCTVTFINQMR